MGARRRVVFCSRRIVKLCGGERIYQSLRHGFAVSASRCGSVKRVAVRGCGAVICRGKKRQTAKYLPTARIVPPPQRRGQGWWFAIPRSSAAGDKNASQTPYKHRLAHASGRRSRSERAFRCVGSWGLPQAAFGYFWRVKSTAPPAGVQAKTFCKALRRR